MDASGKLFNIDRHKKIVLTGHTTEHWVAMCKEIKEKRKNKMQNDFILEEMEKCNADGVDFVPLLSNPLFPEVICSYTKEEWKDVQYYPKSGRLYWKIIDGQKFYLIEKR